MGLTNWHIDDRNALLEAPLSQQTRYDALNRMVRLYSWHSEAQRIHASVYVPAYSLRGTLFAEDLYVQAVLNPDPDGPLPTDALKAIITAMTYDAKGQRQEIRYGNGTKTTYNYDPETFRLIGLKTLRQDPDQPVLQDLHYTYDPTGNILSIEDKAQPTKFCHNQIIEARNDYTYDSMYRLVRATGREHLGQINHNGSDNWHDNPMRQSYACGDDMQWQTYLELYEYDSAGNFSRMQHVGKTTNNWTRTYTTATDSNRLLQTQVGNNRSYTYKYNPHGSMTEMPHLQTMRWDFTEHLCYIERRGNTGDASLQAYYQYDSRKQRSRKVVVKGNIQEERQYWGGFEIYRSSIKNNGEWQLQLERHTQHLVDGSSRVLLADTRTYKHEDYTDKSPKQTYRYQYGNHLGSASLEIDVQANLISYEEYHPYGTTAYQANNKTINATAKRYRYTGMERDDETGLNYHTARYCAPWLGRWISADPIGIEGGMNFYGYCTNSPIQDIDKEGKQSTPSHIRGDIGELEASQWFEDQTRYRVIDFDASISGSTSGAGDFDIMVYDLETSRLLLVDNKAYNGRISRVSAFEPGRLEKNLETANRQLRIHSDIAYAHEALDALNAGDFDLVVSNFNSGENQRFSPRAFNGYLVLDSRTERIYGGYDSWREDYARWRSENNLTPLRRASLPEDLRFSDIEHYPIQEQQPFVLTHPAQEQQPFVLTYPALPIVAPQHTGHESPPVVFSSELPGFTVHEPSIEDLVMTRNEDSAADRNFWIGVAVVSGAIALGLAVDIIAPPLALRHAFGSF